MTDTESTPTSESTETTTSVPVATPRWRTISVKPRVDSFNQQELLDQLTAARTEGCLSIALDLKGNRFLSFPVIRLCTDMARELYDKGGCFALLSYSEKTRRHFEIYGSVKFMRLCKDEGELPAPRAPKVVESAPLKADVVEGVEN